MISPSLSKSSSRITRQIDEEPQIEDTIHDISYHNKVLEEAPPLPNRQSSSEIKIQAYQKPPIISKEKSVEYGAKTVP